jgi:CHASE2 domain-containing sensor protein
MSKVDSTEPKPKLFLKVILIVLLVAGLTILLEHIGWLRGFERAALDTWLRIRLNLSPSVESNHIVIVGVTDKDYKEIFSAKSPLDKEGLEQVIKAIIHGRPALLGVDIDTSDENFQDMQPVSETLIVWAEDVPPEEPEAKVSQTLGPLGGRKPGPQLTGVAQLPMENDGIIRNYQRAVRNRDSFPWVITRAFCNRIKEDVALKAQMGGAYDKLAQRCTDIEHINNNYEEKKEKLAIDFLGDRYKFKHYSTREVLDAYKQNNQELLKALDGKIVLLGGLFHASRDEYTTPVGRMAGVELMAHVIESELQGGGFQHPKAIYMIVLSIAGGIGILLLFIRYGLTKGCLFSILAIIIIAPILSFVAFRSFAYTLYFLPVLFAVLVHQLYSQAHYYQHESLHQLSRKAPVGNAQAAESVNTDRTDSTSNDKGDLPPPEE